MIVLALNELNIQYLHGYIKDGKLPNFKRLLKNGTVETYSETKYELLEPWIQWATVQTGKDFNEHQLFRLGDIVNRPDLKQIFEDLEDSGLTVGAISPFNAENRLKQPKFFIPDPWTQTKASGSRLLIKLSNSISRIVNNNASGRLTLGDVFWLFLGVLSYVRVKRWGRFFNMIRIISKPGVKAAMLDMILLEVFVTQQKKHKPEYSHLFFNGGAHIQHHYMFNSTQYKGNLKNPEWYCPSSWDPLLMILETYDVIIGDLIDTNEKIIALTGLQQEPHDRDTWYWRPKNHRQFLTELKLKVEFEVIPRMSRDFLIKTFSKKEAKLIENHLMKFKDSIERTPIFEIDNRGESLFIELIFDKPIEEDTFFTGPENIEINSLKDKLAFVAIKNGKHHQVGHLFGNYSLGLSESISLKEAYGFIKSEALINKNFKHSVV